MIGFDGSAGAELAVAEVALRHWGNDAEICLVTAVHSLIPTTIGRFIPPINNWVEEDSKSERIWIEKLAESSVKKLENAGLKVSLKIKDGNPKEVLIEEAARWQADSIFVGAHSYSGRLEKFLIGSTSAAVAARANCSVEAVRPKPNSEIPV
jgi:nucleotide-binding universal stress UspA family protein